MDIDIDVDGEVDVEIDRHFGSSKAVSTSAQMTQLNGV